MASHGRHIFAFLLAVFLTTGAAYGLLQTPHALALTDAEKAKLQAEYDQLQQEIAHWQQVLDKTRAQKASLTGDVTALTAQINKAEAEIKQRSNTIGELAGEINQKTEHIQSLEEQIDEGHASLAKILREKNNVETTSLAMVALTADSFSDFFSTADAIDVINNDLQKHFDELRGIKQETEQEKAALDVKKNQQIDAQHEVEVKKDQIAQNQAEKKQLLTITTNQETSYQQVLADRQAKAAAIRAALFPLRDAAAINFGDALTYAQAAQKKTGVDPALILAILTQESNLGQNVGQCYLSNDETGAGAGKNTGTPFAKVMNPTRDVPPFLQLSRQLGFDPHHQVVSCPIAGVAGWGGAMGPAQFIASTWALFANKIASLNGVSVANPWDPRDAIMAMALLLADNGAGAGTYTASHTAAAKYYAGGAWATAGQTYANQVMAKVASIQKNISFLTDNNL